jgi:hypothetical protein
MLQPIMTMITYMVVVGISTVVYHRIILFGWNRTLNLFNSYFVSTSATFADNVQIFGKVYFPRLLMLVAKLRYSALVYNLFFNNAVHFLNDNMVLNAWLHLHTYAGECIFDVHSPALGCMHRVV